MRALDRLRRGGCSTFLPVATSPVSEIIATFGWLISALPTRLAAPEDDIDDAFGKDVGDELGELQHGERRLLGRLDHDGVAAGERRRQLPGRHHQRIVPRRDRGDDADRIAPDHRRVARQILAGDRAVHDAHRAREEAEAVDDRRDLVAEHGVDAACRNSAPPARRSLGVRLDAVGELEQGRRVPPAWSATSSRRPSLPRSPRRRSVRPRPPAGRRSSPRSSGPGPSRRARCRRTSSRSACLCAWRFSFRPSFPAAGDVSPSRVR